MLTLAASPTADEGEDTPEGVDVSAKVDNDTVYLEKFPIKDIVLSIVQDETLADQIVEAVGDVNYKSDMNRHCQKPKIAFHLLWNLNH